MTPLVVEKLAEFLGKPEFCPMELDAGTISSENSFTLDQAQAGSSIEVAMIGEDLEDSVERWVLQNQQMMPGSQTHNPGTL